MNKAEEKRERFKRLATQRTNAALQKLLFTDAVSPTLLPMIASLGSSEFEV